VADIVEGVLAILGAGLILLAGVGVLRFPDLYSRMHAATKATTLGIALIAIAGAVALDDGRAKLILSTVLIFVTAPVASHLVGRSGYRAERIEIRLDAQDDLATLMDETAPDS
jgi:multicomponent Na+:H+ antiporter subunit G